MIGRSRKALFVIPLLSLTVLLSASISEISQWRGESRDGKYEESGLLKQWPEKGPQLRWSTDILGMGYSSVSVTKDRIFTTGMIDNKGYVFALNKSGGLEWKVEYGDEWNKSYPGARTTPTVADGLIYIESTSGDLVCLRAESGEIVWKRNLMNEFDGRNIRWGMTESILVDGDVLYCTPGGKEHNVIALDRFTGKHIWSSEGNKDRPAYCSPTLINHNGKKILVTMTGESILGLEAASGKKLWQHEHKTSWDINPNTPYYKDGKLYCVSGYGTGGVQLELSPDGTQIVEIWRNNTLDIQMDGFIVLDNSIYGSSHQTPAWHCLDWQTGKERFSDPGIGKCNVIFADGMLYCYSDRGKVALVKPDPAKFDLVSSFSIEKGNGEHWAHTVIDDGILYVRHGDTLMAYSIK